MKNNKILLINDKGLRIVIIVPVIARILEENDMKYICFTLNEYDDVIGIQYYDNDPTVKFEKMGFWETFPDEFYSYFN